MWVTDTLGDDIQERLGVGAWWEELLSFHRHQSGWKTALSGVGVAAATRPFRHSGPLGKAQLSSVALELPGS